MEENSSQLARNAKTVRTDSVFGQIKGPLGGIGVEFVKLREMQFNFVGTFYT
jgi:hypothetical protein